MPCQIVKQLDRVTRESRIAGEEPDVGIEPRCLHVVVSGTDMHVAAKTACLTTHNERRLSMGLQPADSKCNVCSCAFQLCCPMEVAFFIKARFDFHDACDLFSMFRGSNE